MMRLALLAGLLAGCSTAPVLQPVSVPVPVACREPIPARPTMPTEALRPGVAVDVFVRAAAAEIERRKGYEGQLLAALVACTADAGSIPP